VTGRKIYKKRKKKIEKKYMEMFGSFMEPFYSKHDTSKNRFDKYPNVPTFCKEKDTQRKVSQN